MPPDKHLGWPNLRALILIDQQLLPADPDEELQPGMLSLEVDCPLKRKETQAYSFRPRRSRTRVRSSNSVTELYERIAC